MRSPIAREALPFAAPLVVLAVICCALQWCAVAGLLVALLIFVLYFFRDPSRTAPGGDDLIVAPGDGKVVRIDYEYQSPDHPDGCVCVSTFLSVFNVHIQRVPIDGTVSRSHYHKGKFLAAWDHKASLENEQSLVVLESRIGKVAVKQIAGLVARRIALWLRVDQKVGRGERLGLIRFGSRVDLIMPPDVEIVCKIGDKVTGAESVMAKIVTTTPDA